MSNSATLRENCDSVLGFSLNEPDELVSLRNANISGAEKSVIQIIMSEIRKEFDCFIGGRYVDLRSKRQRSSQPHPHIRVELYAMQFPKYLVDLVVERLNKESSWCVRRDGLMVHFTRRGAPNENTLSDLESSSSEEDSDSAESEDEAADIHESITHSESDEPEKNKKRKFGDSSSASVAPSQESSSSLAVPALPTN